MRVLLALFTAAALFSARLDAAELHVHVSDHTHEHGHGLAAHHHEQTPRHAKHSGPQMTDDADEHAVLVSVHTVTVEKVNAPVVRALIVAVVDEESITARIRPIVEVRVHGPPPHDNVPLRAPPASSLS